MNISGISSNSWLKCRHLTPGISRILLFSTQTEIISSRADPSSEPKHTLYNRLLKNWNPEIPLTPILDKWVCEGLPLSHEELKRTIKACRKFRRCKHALEISKWMLDMNHFDLTPGDIAIHLDLISKVDGINPAEKFFNSLPESLKVYKVYGALLNCYAEAKSVEKAELLMRKIRKFNCNSTLVYNAMLNLYSHTGQYDKLDSLMQDMEDKGISSNIYSYNIRLHAYAASSDSKGMEKLLMKMEVDPLISVNWHCYVVAAKGYLKTGAIEKATEMLRKAENLTPFKDRRQAYQICICVHASLGNKNEVYRLWNVLNKGGKVFNMNYLAMLSALEKLDDLEGAEKILAEWEEKSINFDIRIPNMMITAYCKKGRISKAEQIIERLVEQGGELNASTWSRMALGYCKSNQMEKGVETTRKALLTTYPGWKPGFSIVASCLIYLIREKNDNERVEEFTRLLENYGQFSAEYKDGLVKYIEDGRLSSLAFDETKEGRESLEEEMDLGDGQSPQGADAT